MRRSHRIQVRVTPHERAALDAQLAQAHTTESDLIRQYLRPILTGERSPTEAVADWFRRRLVKELRDEREHLDKAIAHLEARVHDLEPGTILRGLLQERLDVDKARRATITSKISELEGPP